MRRLVVPGSMFAVCLLLAGCESLAPPVSAPAVAKAAQGKTDDSKPVVKGKVRKFTFHYQFRVKDLKASDEQEKNLVRVWLPCPSSTDRQEVKRLAPTAPAKLEEHTETRYGNHLLYLELPLPQDGGFSVDVPYEVVRHEVLKAASPGSAEQLDDDMRAVFLAADKLVPTDGKPLELLDRVALNKDPFVLARQLYDVVDEHVIYKKEGTGWGRGDTNWVCDSGYGNCTDFHSLFISLARSQGLPSRFEIGFSIPTDTTEGPIAGYHCWGWFYLRERGWIPVDISEADKHPELKDYYFGNLTADRVMFSVGRDLELVPKSSQDAVNFLIYPHIEVGGQVLPKENVELQFSFKEQ